MRKVLIATGAMLSLAVGSAANATITIAPSSASQGTLVHGTGTAATGTVVTADLGTNGPNIVNFNGTTTTNNQLRLQGGSGQADVTGAEINPAPPHNDFSSILSGNIWLTGYTGMSWIELSLDPAVTGTIDFILTDNFGNNFYFNNLSIGPGNTQFAFEASAGEFIKNLFYSIDGPNGITSIAQVRITTAVPEPATWGMMLLGFAGCGFALSRRRKRVPTLLQLA